MLKIKKNILSGFVSNLEQYNEFWVLTNRVYAIKYGKINMVTFRTMLK